jgi:hypothetical protein
VELLGLLGLVTGLLSELSGAVSNVFCLERTERKKAALWTGVDLWARKQQLAIYELAIAPLRGGQSG